LLRAPSAISALVRRRANSAFESPGRVRFTVRVPRSASGVDRRVTDVVAGGVPSSLRRAYVVDVSTVDRATFDRLAHTS